MRRRVLLQWLGATLGTVPLPTRIRAQAAMTPADEARLRAVAEVVLPQELGAPGQDATVTAFAAWLRDYRAGAETDYGYGAPRLRRLPPSPASKYPAQLDALEAAARARGRSFADLGRDDRRALVEAAIAEAKVERLPARPDGGHVATDLLGFFFNSVEANDLCYQAAIGRDQCRTLTGSSERPAPRPRGGR
jgi:erythromycin esterase-like protein